MLPLIIGGGLILGVGVLYVWKQRRRRFLEDRQLQMFIEQLVWDPDDSRFVVDDRVQILPLPPNSIMNANKKSV